MAFSNAFYWPKRSCIKKEIKPQKQNKRNAYTPLKLTIKAFKKPFKAKKGKPKRQINQL
jgi:hypothetical protein